jgi:hypothetical protein
MNKKGAIISISIALLVIAGVLVLAFYSNKPTANYDKFSQCLTEKGAVMYGAVWCSWCKKQKADFGDSFKYINYVECPDEPPRCLAAGVQGYPTWTFQAGKKLEGYQTLEQLSQASGCPL